jgi:hypothetical protein
MAIVTETGTEYVGQVLKVSYNDSYQIMSDIWGSATKVMVWDDVRNLPVTMHYNVCDMGSVYGPAKIEVDATDEVKEKYRQHLVKIRRDALISRAHAEATKIIKGCTVKVVRGRKVKVGTQGKVVAIITSTYGMGYHSRQMLKCGIALDDETVTFVGKNGKPYERHKNVAWVWEMYCERLDPDLVNIYEIEKQAICEIDQDLKRMTG